MAGVQIMNETSQTAKKLVLQVTELTPKVEVQLARAEEKSKLASEQEAEAKVIMDAQASFKIEVEAAKNDADKIMAECKKELAIAEKIKKDCKTDIDLLNDADIKEVGNYGAETLKKEGTKTVLAAVMLILTGKENLDQVKKILTQPKNLKEFDLERIGRELDK